MATKTIKEQASEALDELVKYLESKGIKESSEEEFNIMSARQNAEQEQDHNFNYGDTSDTKCDCDYITINEQIEEAIANYLNDRKFQQISLDDADKIEVLTRVQALRLQVGIEDIEEESVVREFKN